MFKGFIMFITFHTCATCPAFSMFSSRNDFRWALLSEMRHRFVQAARASTPAQ